MKTSILLVVLLTASAFWCPVNADNSPLDKFHEAKAKWDGEVAKVDHGKAQDLEEVTNAFNAMVNAWSNIPISVQKERYFELNRTAFIMAKLNSQKGRYERALSYLNEEMQFQYQHAEGRKVFLSEQNQNFYQEVVKVEAQVLGHLGRSYYLNSIDYYLMPVGPSLSGKLNSFVSMRETSADEEYNITIPPLPKDQDRKILYLLAPDQNGDYAIVASTQLIGFIGKKVLISLSESTSTPTLTLSGITNTVEMKEGVPFKYIPVPSQSVKLEVLPTDFRLIP